MIPPQYPVPDYVTHLLQVASQEVGYQEESRGYTKYGEWSGDPYAQWCAEFLCWCVDQVDQQFGTALLQQVYPLYSGSNTGRDWFITQGRYIARNGNVEGWGYQWLKGEENYIAPGDYIPQPGDWMFFTWTGLPDTDHVAMVEYCTRDENNNVIIHVIEGNNPNSVARATYRLDYHRILGYGTVHDLADITMRRACSGEKVRTLQQQLIEIGYLAEGLDNGVYGDYTVGAVKLFQQHYHLPAYGIANQKTQALITEKQAEKRANDPLLWQIEDD